MRFKAFDSVLGILDWKIGLYYYIKGSKIKKCYIWTTWHGHNSKVLKLNNQTDGNVSLTVGK